MPGAYSIGASPTAVIALAVAAVGAAALWSNPRRAVNAGFFAASILVAIWLVCLEGATHEVAGLGVLAAIVGAFVFVPVWFIKEAIISDGDSATGIFRRSGWWMLACLALGTSRAVDLLAGPVPVTGGLGATGFVLYIAGLAALYATLFWQAIRQVRVQAGLKRLELQIVLLGGSATALTVVALMVLRRVANVSWLTQLYPVVVLLFYTGTVVAMTTSRVFNARQLLTVVLQKLVLVVAISGIAFGVNWGLQMMFSEGLALFTTVAVSLGVASLFSEWLDRVLEFYPHGKTARQAALAAAQRERNVDQLEGALKAVLAGWGHADRAVIVSGNARSLSGDGIHLEGDGPVFRAMRQLRWATPERLVRERVTPDRMALREFLQKNQLGVVALEEGVSLTVLVGVGWSASRRPYTYPQVVQLRELASIVEGAIERAHFSAKVQHTEQLATIGLIGASLAHEIRNPLVSIKTFSQLLPTHYQNPEFRQKFFRLIGDEVARIDQLTDQLLDMAAPRAYSAQMLDLHPLLQGSVDLVATKASHKQVELRIELQAAPDKVFTDPSAVKQVMLNLCFNAVQAVDGASPPERWVKIATRNTAEGVEMAVSDSGPGIAPEIRARLFQPFQTTKSSGFGLGLAICSDILGNLNASITADPHEPGRGATFRVTFPCRPFSS